MQYLRTEQAAQFLNVSRSFLEKRRIDGCGPPYLKAGRLVLYDPDRLREWASSHTRHSTSDAIAGAQQAGNAA